MHLALIPSKALSPFSFTFIGQIAGVYSICFKFKDFKIDQSKGGYANELPPNERHTLSNEYFFMSLFSSIVLKEID